MSDTATTVIEDVQDTYISLANPNQTYYTDTVLRADSSSTILFDIPISFVRSGSKVQSARLHMSPSSGTSKFLGTVRQLDTDDFVLEQATWNSKRTNGSWKTAGGDFLLENESVFSVSSYPELVLGDSATGYWKLNDASGTTATDYIASGVHNGTYQNSPTLAQAGSNTNDPNCFSTLFKSSSSQYVTASPTLPTSGAAFTLETWIKPLSHTNNDAIICYGTSSTGNGVFIRLSAGESGTTYAIRYGFSNNDIVADVGSTLVDGNWHQVVFTWGGQIGSGGDGKRTLYLDGTIIYQDIPSSPTLTYPSSGFQIGRLYSTSSYFNGYIDEVSLYNYALSKTTVLDHYKAGINFWIDITDIVQNVVLSSLSNIRIGIKSVSTTSAGVTFNSAGALDLSKRPYLTLVYTAPEVLSNDSYSRVLGSWVSSDDNSVPFIVGPTHIALGNSPKTGSSVPDPKTVSSLVSETTRSRIFSKGSSDYKARYMTDYNYAALNASTTEFGLFRQTGGVELQTPMMRHMTPAALGDYVNEVISDRPISYWRLGEAGGTLACDEMANWHGTINSATPGAVGMGYDSNPAYTFAASQNVSVADGSVFNFDGLKPFSVEFWAFVTSTAGKHVIISKEATGPARGWEIYIANGLNVNFSRYDGSTTQVTSSLNSLVGTSTWGHVVCVFDGSQMSIYINGRNEINTGGTSNVSIPSHSTNLLIGAEGAGNSFVGRLDEVAIYDYALPAHRIRSHYSTAKLVVASKDFTDSTNCDYSLTNTGNGNTGSFPIQFNPNVDCGSVSELTGKLSLNYKLPSWVGTIDSTTSTTMTDSSESFPSFIGFSLDITNPAQRRFIASNTGTVITVTSDFSGSPSGIYVVTYIPYVFQVEIGNDSRNMYIWEVSAENLLNGIPIMNGSSWGTIVLDFNNATKVGSPKMGRFSHFRTIWSSVSTNATSTLLKIGNLSVYEDYTESTMIARGDASAVSKAISYTGNEITDEQRRINICGDGYSDTQGMWGIYQSTSNLITNSSFETNTTGWTPTAGTTATRVNNASKFGSYSLQLVNTTAGTDDYDEFTVSGVSGSTTYTVSAWLYTETFEGSALSNRALAAWDGTNVSTFTASTVIQKTIGWERHKITLTTIAAGMKVRLYSPKGTVYWDGIQVEAGRLRTPYVFTDGAAKTRSAGRVVMPVANSMIASQLWVAAEIKSGWSNTEAVFGNNTIFDWTNGSAYFRIWFSCVNGGETKWRVGVNNGAGSGDLTVSCDSNLVFQEGDRLVVAAYVSIGQFGSNPIGISVNGSNFFTGTGASLGNLTSTLFDIGSKAGSSEWCNTNIKWMAIGNGMLTNSDAASLYNTYDPTLTYLSRTLSNPLMRLIWLANNDEFSTDFSLVNRYRSFIDLNINDPKIEY